MIEKIKTILKILYSERIPVLFIITLSIIGFSLIRFLKINLIITLPLFIIIASILGNRF